MVGKDSHLPINTGNDDDVRIAFKDHPVLRDDFTTNWHGITSSD
jgi:hypothetical protein